MIFSFILVTLPEKIGSIKIMTQEKKKQPNQKRGDKQVTKARQLTTITASEELHEQRTRVDRTQ